MSLINKMLKDLENQRNKTRLGGSDPALTGLNAPMSKNGQRTKSIILLCVLIVLGVAILIYNYLPIVIKHKTKTAAATPTLVNKTTTASVPTKATAPTPEMVIKEIPSEPEVQLEQYEFTPSDTSAQLKLSFDKPVHYVVEHTNNNKQLIITFTNTKLLKEQTTIATNDWIDPLEFQPQDNNLVLTINLKTDVTLDELDLSPEETMVTLEFINAKTTTQDAAVINKTPLPLSPAERATHLYNSALNLISLGNTPKATSELMFALSLNPNLAAARESLVAILLKQGDKEKASRVLTQGLVIDPNNTSFVKLQARILASQNQIQRALAIMQQHSPEITKDPNYYALMAALYQRNGQYTIAIQIYSELTNNYPMCSLWWAGLGVVYELNGDGNSAEEAFKTALKGDMNVSTEMRAYILSKAGN